MLMFVVFLDALQFCALIVSSGGLVDADLHAVEFLDTPEGFRA